jgi:hypothetical protein
LTLPESNPHLPTRKPRSLYRLSYLGYRMSNKPLHILKIIFKVSHKFLVTKLYERHHIKKSIFQLQHTAALLDLLRHKYRAFIVKTQPLRNTFTYLYRGYVFRVHAFVGAHL